MILMKGNKYRPNRIVYPRYYPRLDRRVTKLCERVDKLCKKSGGMTMCLYTDTPHHGDGLAIKHKGVPGVC